MRFDFEKLNIGDVMVTRSGGMASWFIRFGQKIAGSSNKVNHVIIVHHRDDAGVLWGIEGRPGGVGWVQLDRFKGDLFANANVEQPKTDYQRQRIAELAGGMLQTPYDWEGIVLDGMKMIGAQVLWRVREWKDDLVPAQVVCSSYADYVYEVVELANPGGDKVTRSTSPGDWDMFIENKGWE